MELGPGTISSWLGIFQLLWIAWPGFFTGVVMARGDKDYFRHSFRARNDDFIVSLMRKMKEKGYFMWFALIELCSERMADGDEPPYTFDQSTLYKELRCTQHTLNQFLTLAQSMLKIDSTYVKPMFNIDIKNLNKFNGHYPKKSPNKRKEKEIKEKKRKGKEKEDKIIKPSSTTGPISDLSGIDQIDEVLNNVTQKTQNSWVQLYHDAQWIKSEISKCIIYFEGREVKSWGKTISNWLSSPYSKKPQKSTGQAIDDFFAARGIEGYEDWTQ